MLGLKDSRAVYTPITKPLGKCHDATPISGEFNYCSAIGVAMYLTNNTRLDCSMAIHQCARFCANPRLPHEKAVKRIGRYLKGSQSQGLIIQPTTSLKLDCFVDTDFAGIWGFEDKQDPSSARSCTGFLITLGKIPVYRASRMQLLVALSTMEAEYIALSTAMRSLIPMHNILSEFIETHLLEIDPQSKFQQSLRTMRQPRS